VKTALITGIAGRDGPCLAEHPLGLGYRVLEVDLRRMKHDASQGVAR
jgi:GDP-D-mannose dehydratase